MSEQTTIGKGTWIDKLAHELIEREKTLGRGEPATTDRPLQTRNTWGARPTGRRLFCKQKIGVRFPGAPLIEKR